MITAARPPVRERGGGVVQNPWELVTKGVACKGLVFSRALVRASNDVACSAASSSERPSPGWLARSWYRRWQPPKSDQESQTLCCVCAGGRLRTGCRIIP
jgi:hypothetical protein